jgi:hypothetical protein
LEVSVAKDEKEELRIDGLVQEFCTACSPLETRKQLLRLTDGKTSAQYIECHIVGSKLVSLGTTSVPLDPEEQAEYKANRDIEENSAAFGRMIDDAKAKRSFSNIVAEWTKEWDAESPLKVIGGQHRFEAIKEALVSGIDVHHGVKLYFGLNMEQRYDVQLISNTNIEISGDLIDRLNETRKGSNLRDWCHSTGLLAAGDFADSYIRNGPISVRMATTFITNFFNGKKIDAKTFESVETAPVLFKSGGSYAEWEKTKSECPDLWNDKDLHSAAVEFAALVAAQRAYFENPKNGKGKRKPDYPEKALNLAVLASWAYVAGMLHKNSVRLERHYALKKCTSHDPLNSAALADGKGYLDGENYRGLGYRTDPQERGRLVELFFLQAEDGKGITKASVDLAIKKYYAKQALLAVETAKEKRALEHGN